MLVFAVLLYPVYLAVGNWMLRSGVERWLNRRPERFRLQYDSAWTVWPGVVERDWKILQPRKWFAEYPPFE